MNTPSNSDKEIASSASRSAKGIDYDGRAVLVLQGRGALGVYQVGVYQARHEASVEPNWVIGPSIVAINGAIIAGNEPGMRRQPQGDGVQVERKTLKTGSPPGG